MFLTAHGGALKTGRNTQKYFDKMAEVKPAAIEVDLRSRRGRIVCAHVPEFSYKNNLTLEFVFEFVKKHNVRVNCDLKEWKLLKPVIEVAKAMGAEKHLIFTGNIKKSLLKYADCGEIYVNTNFYRGTPCTAKNLEKIWSDIKKLNCPQIAGLNINYSRANDEFLAKARQLGIPLSIYTVDNEELLKKFIAYRPANITTNLIDVAMRLAGDV